MINLHQQLQLLYRYGYSKYLISILKYSYGYSLLHYNSSINIHSMEYLPVIYFSELEEFTS